MHETAEDVAAMENDTMHEDALDAGAEEENDPRE